MRFASILVVLSAGALAGGCQSYYFTDSVDFELDFSPLLTHSDDLHSPYVTGAHFTVFAESTDEDEGKSDWSIESSDPGVLRVDSNAGGQAELVALAPGSATLTVRDLGEGEVLHSEIVEVRAPASADLMWHGTLLLHRPEEEARVTDAQIVTGGTGTFLVRWLDDQGRRLSGNRALGVEAETAGVTVAVEDSFLFEDRDWLQITPMTEGAHQVRITAGGFPVGAFTVTAVAPEAVAGIELQGESERGKEDGACLVVLAVATDAAGAPIYGIEYAWDVDGESMRDYGDLLHYDFDDDAMVTVGASYGEHRQEAVVHASGGFYVSSSNSVGCSAGGNGAGLPALGAPLALAGLWVLGRSRRRR